jgi:hypothetical protein
MVIGVQEGTMLHPPGTVLRLLAVFSVAGICGCQPANRFEAETEAAFQGKACPRQMLATRNRARIDIPGPQSSGLTVLTFLTSSRIPCRVEAPILDRFTSDLDRFFKP